MPTDFDRLMAEGTQPRCRGVRTVPWAFQGLDWTGAKPRLRQLHAQSQNKPIDAISHRFQVLATG